MFKTSLAILVAATIGGSVQAANLVTNGGFETTTLTSNSQFGAGFGGQAVTGWTGLGGNHLQFYYFGGTAATTNAVNQFGDPGGYFRSNFVESPAGGSVIGLDGDSDYSGSLSQSIGGLTPGKAYDLKFVWAASQLRNRTGPTTEQLLVTFGSDTALTGVVANPSEGFTGWFSESFRFTAASATQALTFLSIGTPNGLPPMAVLDGVSLTTVPEPGVWMLLIAGFGLVGLAARRRSAEVAA